MKNILFILALMHVSYLNALDFNSLKTHPADPSTYSAILSDIGQASHETCDIECILGMFHGLCETFYSRTSRSIELMQRVFKNHRSEIKESDWFNCFKNKKWFSMPVGFGCQFVPMDVSYTDEEILDIRNTILEALDKAIQKIDQEEYLPNIKYAFEILNKVKCKTDFNTSLDDIVDYL